jgi:hypothetical protein
VERRKSSVTLDTVPKLIWRNSVTPGNFLKIDDISAGTTNMTKELHPILS